MGVQYGVGIDIGSTCAKAEVRTMPEARFAGALGAALYAVSLEPV